jgi:hypothetical protein
MKHLKIAPLVILVFIILLMSFTNKKTIEDPYQLDTTTVIIPIIENEDSDIQSEKYIRTFKVFYQDRLAKPIKLQNGERLFNRCSYESQIIFYSEEDSLAIGSWKRMSCEIIAFFNLQERDNMWLKTHVIKKIKIVNITTDACFEFDKLDKPNYFFDLLNTYNRKVKL